MEYNLSFGQALDQLKQGQSIARKGWNGKNMFVYLNKGSYDFPNTDGHSDFNEGDLIEGVSEKLFENGHHGTITRLPNINMRTATGSTVTGWLASQTDLLADDWGVLPEPE